MLGHASLHLAKYFSTTHAGADLNQRLWGPGPHGERRAQPIIGVCDLKKVGAWANKCEGLCPRPQRRSAPGTTAMRIKYHILLSIIRNVRTHMQSTPINIFRSLIRLQ
jgi:hypothetical protein